MIKNTLLIIILLLSNLYAREYTAFLRAGMNYGNVQSEKYKTTFRTGLLIGGAIDCKISEIFSVQTELNFIQKAYRENNIQVNNNYLELPVLFKMRFLPNASFYLGPNAGILLNTNGNMTPDNNSIGSMYTQLREEDFHNYDFGTVLGMSYDFHMDRILLQTDCRFHLGFTNISKFDHQNNFGFSLSFALGKSNLPMAVHNEVEQLKINMKKELKYIMTTKQIRKLEKTKSIQEINDYITEFWNENDPTPGTVDNEMKTEYYRRITFADSAFKETGLGSETDRGRVYIIYGKPDEVVYEVRTNSPFILNEGTIVHTYEIWLYHKPGLNSIRNNIFSDVYPGMMRFIFSDFHGIGMYTQIFSTEEGETIDPRIFFYQEE